MTTSGPDIVIVTGTSGGLGSATAKVLVSNGFRVVGIARRAVQPESVGASADEYVHYEFDLANTQSIDELVRMIIVDVGKPYGLVNNAAVGTDGLLPTMHNSEIEHLITLNVTSPILLTKFVVRHMLSARRGRVVNVSSVVARTGYRGLAAYGATKAAMEGFTRSLARDVGRRNVTVNAVAPGFLATDMTANLGETNLDRIQGRAALGRFADVEEVASTVGFLMSDRGSGITGTVLTVDAGGTA